MPQDGFLSNVPDGPKEITEQIKELYLIVAPGPDGAEGIVTQKKQMGGQTVSLPMIATDLESLMVIWKLCGPALMLKQTNFRVLKFQGCEDVTHWAKQEFKEQGFPVVSAERMREMLEVELKSRDSSGDLSRDLGDILAGRDQDDDEPGEEK